MDKKFTRAGMVLVVAAALSVGAVGAAQAKSGATLTASPTHVKVGKTVTLRATGGDDADEPFALCIQQQVSHKKWRDVGCKRASRQDSVTLVKKVKETHVGRHTYRVVDIIGTGHSAVRVPEVSVTVTVRR
ncbi:hypothetical protein EFY87_13545 [Flexivirga caeni]|uniref:Uncharacterized protein n=2 Tax=Flexivirga caeni TaxID=2294115 RepID=A0A3M9M5X7_9MICO|nr:hypothetical protein EFY87_13545 [Flexivirga caeni]